MGHMIQQYLKSLITKRRCTLLGVGPMSLNCVDATIELANEYDVPIMLIASRRQIDSENFGGGYVNNWSTHDFAHYVRKNDKKNKVILARDHGGPWQNSIEVSNRLTLRQAMESAKSSYHADIEAGFQILHIDPSVDLYEQPSTSKIIDRIFELYEFCFSQAKRMNKDIVFEIGTEEQTGSTNTQDELEQTINSVYRFCKKNNFPKPLFIVIQCGTKVMEMRNIGTFESPVRILDEIPVEIQLPTMIEICNRYKVFMKEHNTDYLSNEALRWHPKLGIHAANVAPEFGVTETKALLFILESQGLSDMVERFLRLSYESKKWDKWMLKNSKSTDRDRAIIAGHYVFSSPECIEIKNEARRKLSSKGFDLDCFLKQEVKRSIMRYLYYFRLTDRMEYETSRNAYIES